MNLVADGRAEFMIASHNQESIEKATKLMHEMGLPPQQSPVYFGQLLGMADPLSYVLGANGYRVRHPSGTCYSPHEKHLTSTSMSKSCNAVLSKPLGVVVTECGRRTESSFRQSVCADPVLALKSCDLANSCTSQTQTCMHSKLHACNFLASSASS